MTLTNEELKKIELEVTRILAHDRKKGESLIKDLLGTPVTIPEFESFKNRAYVLVDQIFEGMLDRFDRESIKVLQRKYLKINRIIEKTFEPKKIIQEIERFQMIGELVYQRYVRNYN